MIEDIFANELAGAVEQMGRTTFTRLSMLTNQLQELVNKDYLNLTDDEPAIVCWQNMITYAEKGEFAKAAASCREAGEHIAKMSKEKGDLPYEVSMLYIGVAAELQFKKR